MTPAAGAAPLPPCPSPPLPPRPAAPPAACPALRPVAAPRAPAASAGGPAVAAVDVAPVATLPIGAEVAGVSGCDPVCAPLACRINAAIARYWSAPRFSPDGGIALWMYSKRSRVVRARHVLRKFEPASCGASLRPARSGKWQLAQLVW